jgi:hypothetical protein
MVQVLDYQGRRCSLLYITSVNSEGDRDVYGIWTLKVRKRKSTEMQEIERELFSRPRTRRQEVALHFVKWEGTKER